MSNSPKKWAICSFAHFWWATWAIRSRKLIPSEQPERICHGCSFSLSDLSDSLTSSLRRNEQIFFFFFTVKTYKKTIFSNFFERIAHFLWANEKMTDLLKQNRAIRSFTHFLRDLRKWLTFAHLSWANWAICSQSLICSWATWANHSHSQICPERF